MIVQRGTASFGATDTSTVVTLDTPVPVGQSFALSSSPSNLVRNFVRATLQTNVGGNWTELLVERGATTEGATTADWQVVSDPALTVQIVPISIGGSATSQAETINAVDLSKAFLLLSWTATTNLSRSDQMLAAHFTSDAEVTIHRNGSLSALVALVYVVEWEGATVQSGTITTATTTDTATITAVDLAKAFVIGTSTAIVSTEDRIYGTLDLSDTTTVRHRRANGSSPGSTVRFFVVEHPDFSVQRGDVLLDSAGAAETVAITVVDLTKAFSVTRPTGNGRPTHHHTAKLTAVDELTLDPASTANVDTAWQVVEVADGGGDPGDPPQTAEPVADVSNSGWSASTGSDMFAMLDEATANDADFIDSSVGRTTDTTRLRLAEIDTVTTGTGDTEITVRAGKVDGNGDYVTTGDVVTLTLTLLMPNGDAMDPAVTDDFVLGALADHVLTVPSGVELSGQHLVEIVKTSEAA